MRTGRIHAQRIDKGRQQEWTVLVTKFTYLVKDLAQLTGRGPIYCYDLRETHTETSRSTVWEAEGVGVPQRISNVRLCSIEHRQGACRYHSL